MTLRLIACNTALAMASASLHAAGHRTSSNAPGLHLTGQARLLSLNPELEEVVQRYAAQLLLHQGQSVEPARGWRPGSAARFFVEIDVDSLEQLRPRSVEGGACGAFANARDRVHRAPAG